MSLRIYRSKADCVKIIKKHDTEASELDNDLLQNMIFKHQHTYSLNDYGKFILSKYFKSYNLLFKSESMNQRVMLNRLIESPFHYCSKSEELTIFDEKLTFYIKLCGGTKEWLENESSKKED